MNMNQLTVKLKSVAKTITFTTPATFFNWDSGIFVCYALYVTFISKEHTYLQWCKFLTALWKVTRFWGYRVIRKRTRGRFLD